MQYIALSLAERAAFTSRLAAASYEEKAEEEMTVGWDAVGGKSHINAYFSTSETFILK